SPRCTWSSGLSPGTTVMPASVYDAGRPTPASNVTVTAAASCGLPARSTESARRLAPVILCMHATMTASIRGALRPAPGSPQHAGCQYWSIAVKLDQEPSELLHVALRRRRHPRGALHRTQRRLVEGDVAGAPGEPDGADRAVGRDLEADLGDHSRALG